MPYGTVSDHGTIFVGVCAEQKPLQTMLESMAGVHDGVRDALTKYTHPVSGAYLLHAGKPGHRVVRSCGDHEIREVTSREYPPASRSWADGCRGRPS